MLKGTESEIPGMFAAPSKVSYVFQSRLGKILFEEMS